MGTSEQITMPKLGEDGDPCAQCGTPLASDQRYCLGCGARRGGARLPYERYLDADADADRDRSVTTTTLTGPAADRADEVSPIGIVLGIALLGGMLLIGVLLGRSDGEQTVAPATQTTIAASPTDAESAAGAPEPGGAVVSEWPEGKNGFTIELGTLPKDGTTTTDVEATKTDLEGQGATDLGVLDSDLYPSLPEGNFVVYSGVYDTRDDADAALKSLGDAFPSAAVIEVSDKQATASTGGGGGRGGDSGGGEVAAQPTAAQEAQTEALQQETADDLAQLEQATGDEYQDQVANAPDQIATPGEAPPIDTSGEAGAGTEAEVIE